jgi:hypothetical protein
MQVRLSLAAIETAKENLEALPPAARETREVGLREAIRVLTPTIRKLIRRGYTRAKVVALLQEQGMTLSMSTLKQYFRERTSDRGEEEGADGLKPSAKTGRFRGQLRSQSDGTASDTGGVESGRRVIAGEQRARGR